MQNNRLFLKTCHAWLMLAIGLLVSVFAGIQVKRDIECDAARQFEFTSAEVALRIQERLEAYALFLQSGAGVFAGSSSADREGWRAYVEKLRAHESVPGVQGIGFSKIIPPHQLAAHIASIRAEGFSEYTVWPAGERAVYSAIIYLEPFEGRNLRAFGFDMFSEPVRRNAMERARDTGRAALSGKVILVQETGKDVQAGTLMYVPIYRNNALVDTVDQRRSALIGWVYSPYRMDDLMRGILDNWATNDGKVVGLQIYDGPEAKADQLLFHNHPARVPQADSPFYRQRKIELHGSQWLLVSDAVAGTATISYAGVWTTLIGGFTFSSLVCGLMLLVVKTRARAKVIANTLTEEIRARESSLQESEARFHSLYDSITEGVALHQLICDRNGNAVDYILLDVNAAFEVVMELGRGSVIGRKATDVYGLTPPPCLEQFAQVASSGEPVHFETDFLPMGKTFSISVFSSAKNQFTTVFENISERKQAEKALLESENRFHNLLKNIPSVAVQGYGEDGTTHYWSQTSERLYGYSAEEAVGRNLLQLIIPEEMRDGVRADMREMFETMTPIPVGELSLLRKDGSRVDVFSSHVYVHVPGRAPELFCLDIDITERKQAERTLAAEKERLAVTLRSIGDGVITTDIQGRILMLNRVAETLTAWDNLDAVGRPLEDVFRIINEQTREVCENPVAKAMNTGQIVGLANHTVLVAKDGTERSIADSGAPIMDAESRIVGVVLVFRDVTEQSKTERELLKIKKLESIGVLAGGIAHDFNNILTAILGNINLALYDQALEDKTRKLLSEAEKASLRAKDLTMQLLTFAKGGEPVKELSSLEDVIKDSAGFVLRGDKVACRYSIPADLWPVDIDKGQISQVIQNIVLNASQAMPEGGVIDVRCENLANAGGYAALPLLSAGRYVRITIQDNGIGIPANLVEKIFDPYFTTKQEGSGLGLAITQSIIYKHNGRIMVESTPGKGSLFTILLPASEKAAVFERRVPEEQQASSQARILLMDDDEMIRNVTGAMLTHLGHDITCASDGKEAIRLYQEALEAGRRFDLVIMDLTIPGGMGGKEAVLKVLQIDPAATVMVSSGYSNDPIMANCMEYGFKAALVKPLQLQELSKTIGRILRSR